MKKLLVASVVALTSAVVLAQAQAVRKVRPRGRAKQSGGIVEQAYSGKLLTVCNGLADLENGKLAGAIRKIRYGSMLPVELRSASLKTGACPLAAADELAGRPGVGAAVLIADDGRLPIVLASPDRSWAILNVHALRADGPDEGKLAGRIEKALWNAVARSIGAGGSSLVGTALSHYSSVEGLDAIRLAGVGPDAHNAMIDLAEAHGIRPIRFAGYRTACQQGWAPAPTNDAQRAIWDEVHKLPTEPIKIKPETRKVER